MAPAGLVEEITQQLQEAGLRVDAPFGPYRGWAEMLVCREMEQDPTGIHLASEMGIISFATNRWYFRVWKSTPGPGPMDFEHEVTSVGELVALVRQFFLGESLTIEGWVVPMHRHPEWNESHLRLAIAQAQPLPFSTWKQVRQRAQEHYDRLLRESHPGLTNHPRTVSWHEWYQCLFVPLVRWSLADHERPSHGETLWIRRDLREAYLVQKPEAPF